MEMPYKYIQQGWQCPVCGKVHAPRASECDCHNSRKRNNESCLEQLHDDAADALEAADAYETAWTKKCERLEKRIAKLEAQLPKQDRGICMTAIGTLYVPNYEDER